NQEKDFLVEYNYFFFLNFLCFEKMVGIGLEGIETKMLLNGAAEGKQNHARAIDELTITTNQACEIWFCLAE
ncbi:MAG: hypothetical protein ACXWW0_09450, partial [Bacteroidia bacterium]